MRWAGVRTLLCLMHPQEHLFIKVWLKNWQRTPTRSKTTAEELASFSIHTTTRTSWRHCSITFNFWIHPRVCGPDTGNSCIVWHCWLYLFAHQTRDRSQMVECTLQMWAACVVNLLCKAYNAMKPRPCLVQDWRFCEGLSGLSNCQLCELATVWQ